MTVHTFQPTTNSKSPCSVEGCGKTRNTAVHGYVKPSARVEEHQNVEVTTPAKKAEKAEKAGARVPADTAGSFWIGWRVAQAAIAAGGTLGAKVGAAKPTQLRYYRAHLTTAEIQELDAIAAKFQEPGNDGYARRAATTLRVEIAAVKGLK